MTYSTDEQPRGRTKVPTGWPDPDAEMHERMATIALLAGHVGDDQCENCEGEGLDYEGAEWTLCECVLHAIDPEKWPKP